MTLPGRLRFMRFLPPVRPGRTDRFIPNYSIQPRHWFGRNGRLPGKFHKRFLNRVFRAVAQLPGVQVPARRHADRAAGQSIRALSTPSSCRFCRPQYENARRKGLSRRKKSEIIISFRTPPSHWVGNMIIYSICWLFLSIEMSEKLRSLCPGSAKNPIASVRNALKS